MDNHLGRFAYLTILKSIEDLNGKYKNYIPNPEKLNYEGHMTLFRENIKMMEAQKKKEEKKNKNKDDNDDTASQTSEIDNENENDGKQKKKSPPQFVSLSTNVKKIMSFILTRCMEEIEEMKLVNKNFSGMSYQGDILKFMDGPTMEYSLMKCLILTQQPKNSFADTFDVQHKIFKIVHERLDGEEFISSFVVEKVLDFIRTCCLIITNSVWEHYLRNQTKVNISTEMFITSIRNVLMFNKDIDENVICGKIHEHIDPLDKAFQEPDISKEEKQKIMSTIDDKAVIERLKSRLNSGFSILDSPLSNANNNGSILPMEQIN